MGFRVSVSASFLALRSVVAEEARVRMDDALTVFDKLPETGCAKPSVLAARTGVLYVVPAPTQTRGPSKASRSVGCRKFAHCTAPEWAVKVVCKY